MCGCGCGCGYWQLDWEMCGCGCGWQKWKVNNTYADPDTPTFTRLGIVCKITVNSIPFFT